MKPVKITKHETCRTYAFKRIGLDNLLDINTDEPSIKSLIRNEEYQHLLKPEKGCLIVWVEKNPNYCNIGSEITEEGIVINDSKVTYGHLGVYEGDGLFSDVTTVDEYPSIRIRKLDTLADADYFLKPIIN